MKIIPAILENCAEDFEKTLLKVVSFADRVQVDFDDGSFGGHVTVAASAVKEIVKKYSDKISFEAHLMVQRPLEYLSGLEEAGFKKVILQAEKEGELRNCLEEFSYQGFLTGLGIAPESDIEILEPYLDLIDSVLILTIEPGNQGQEFVANGLKKIKQLANLGFGGEIEVDGGIDQGNIKLVEDRGGDIAVVGHYIVKSDDPQAKFDQLSKLVKLD